jgi:hypothetical protein
MNFVQNDGGRSEAGYKGYAGDCVCRSICIATGKPYKEVYSFLAEMNSKQKGRNGKKRPKTAAKGISVNKKWFKDYMKELGFEWVITMRIGDGCKVHLCEEELPKEGTLIVRLSKHYSTVIDGVIHDTYDPSREGRRCVYGYWRLKSK